MHLVRGPEEGTDTELAAFYERLLTCLDQPAFRDGEWQLLDTRPAWEGNASNDAFICYAWSGPHDERRLVVANYAAHASQCYVPLPWSDLVDWKWRFADALSDATYEREGSELGQRGLYLDLAPWGHHVFVLKRGALSADA
jgi:hypothetical protein